MGQAHFERAGVLTQREVTAEERDLPANGVTRVRLSLDGVFEVETRSNPGSFVDGPFFLLQAWMIPLGAVPGSKVGPREGSKRFDSRLVMSRHGEDVVLDRLFENCRRSRGGPFAFVEGVTARVQLRLRPTGY